MPSSLDARIVSSTSCEHTSMTIAQNSVAPTQKPSSDEVEQCAICLDDLSPNSPIRTLRECHHHYHPHCIASWVNKHVNTSRLPAPCPVCRTQIKDIKPVISPKTRLLRCVTEGLVGMARRGRIISPLVGIATAYLTLVQLASTSRDPKTGTIEFHPTLNPFKDQEVLATAMFAVSAMVGFAIGAASTHHMASRSTQASQAAEGHRADGREAEMTQLNHGSISPAATENV